MKNRPLRERVGFALAGWQAGWRRERSFRTQVVMSGVALALLVVLRPPPIWWAVMALLCALVLALELINGAIEAAIDLMHPGIHPEIRAAKDMLAGAVLAISTAALLVGAALLVDRLPLLEEWFR